MRSRKQEVLPIFGFVQVLMVTAKAMGQDITVADVLRAVEDWKRALKESATH